MISTLAVTGYRSIVDLVVPLGKLTVVTGPNGSGKSNLYRALRLLASAATGDIVGHVAAEGGLDSILWAGPESPREPGGAGSGAQGTTRKRRVGLRLGFASDELGYLIDLGLPQADAAQTVFARDPEVKVEQVFGGPFPRPGTTYVDRRRAGLGLKPYESVLTDLADADATPELHALRRTLLGWRFYDHFRTDPLAASRHPQVGTRALRLAHDGANLAAAWASAEEDGYGDVLAAEVDRAFSGSEVRVAASDEGGLRVRMSQPGLLRPLEATELSDGTLRYLLLVAALHPARPAPFVVLDEPESSLHPDLSEPLGRMIVAATAASQILVVTHAADLATALGTAGASRIALRSEGLGTQIEGQGRLDAPAWHWPSR